MDRADAGQNRDDTVVVTSHLLLNAVGVIIGSAATLRQRLGRLDRAEALDMLGRIEDHGRLVARFVEDMARGLPVDVRTLVEELDETRTGRQPQTW
jgi:hypothetical protein